MNVQELKEKDPSRFQREYEEWYQHGLWRDWWDGVQEMFTEACKAKGVQVDKIWFSLNYSQGDYAAFEGALRVHEVMEHLKLAEPYPALYFAVKDYNTIVAVSCRYWTHSQVNGLRTYDMPSVPCGIFADLDEDTWDDLIETQVNEANLDEVLQEMVDGLCGELYRQLRAEYEYLTSKESFIEHCEANEITFEGESK